MRGSVTRPEKVSSATSRTVSRADCGAIVAVSGWTSGSAGWVDDVLAGGSTATGHGPAG